MPDEGKEVVDSLRIGERKVLAVYDPIQPGRALVAGI